MSVTTPALIEAMRRISELLRAGSYCAAHDELETIVAANPTFVEALRLLAGAKQGLAVAAPLCSSGKADAELAAQHIAALAALGRQEEAVDGYRRIAAASPDDPAAAHALAIALNTAGQPAEAVEIAHRTLARGHRSAALCNTYARGLIAQGALDRAEAALRECLQLEPRLIEAQTSLAQLVWMRTGDLGQATAALDQALERFPSDDTLRAAKPAILQGAGDARAAYACL